MPKIERSLGFAVTATAAVLMSSFSIISMAEEVNVIQRDYLVEDQTGGAYQIRQSVFDNGNGTYTLIPGQRPADLKAIHEDICASVGGEDVYDESITTVSADVIDVAVCNITDRKALMDLERTEAENRASVGVNAEGDEVSTSGLYFPPALNLIPPNRDVPVRINYRLRGYIEYYTKNGGRYNASMQADKCGINNSGTVGTNAKGTLYINTLCVSHEPGTWPVYLNACIPGLCAQATGQIRARE